MNQHLSGDTKFIPINLDFEILLLTYHPNKKQKLDHQPTKLHLKYNSMESLCNEVMDTIFRPS